MAKCDLCSGSVSAYDLSNLLACYQTGDVKDICPECLRWTNKQLDDIRSQNAPELRRRIAQRANPDPKPFWPYGLFKSKPASTVRNGLQPAETPPNPKP